MSTPRTDVDSICRERRTNGAAALRGCVGKSESIGIGRRRDRSDSDAPRHVGWSRWTCRSIRRSRSPSLRSEHRSGAVVSRWCSDRRARQRIADANAWASGRGPYWWFTRRLRRRADIPLWRNACQPAVLGCRRFGSIDPNRPTIFTSIREQLGLKLDSRRAAVDVLVIDQVELPAPD